jgi:hypothetical protein
MHGFWLCLSLHRCQNEFSALSIDFGLLFRSV